MQLRRTPQTVQVLRDFLDTPLEWRHGYDLSRCSGLKSGTLYPILIRLTENRLLETRWEASESGKPPRHMYRLTAAGKRFARECVEETRGIAVKEPAFGV
jgi:PadR family transcriptional regulator, regulatory protein PadR